MKRMIGAALAAAVMVGGTAHAQDARWKFSTGLDYSSGDYGADEDTQYFSVPVEAQVTVDRLRFEVSVPWISVEGPAEVIGGGPIGSPSTDTGTRSGLGDVQATAGVTVLRGEDRRSGLELAGRVKFPTADEDIGTGETDFAASANGRAAVSDTTILFGTIGYEWMGDPEGEDIKDGALASAGVNFSPRQGMGFGGAVSYRQAYTEGGDDQIMISPYFYKNLTETVGLTLYAGAGLTDASPDVAAGFRLSLYK